MKPQLPPPQQTEDNDNTGPTSSTEEGPHAEAKYENSSKLDVRQRSEKIRFLMKDEQKKHTSRDTAPPTASLYGNMPPRRVDYLTYAGIQSAEEFMTTLCTAMTASFVQWRANQGFITPLNNEPRDVIPILSQWKSDYMNAQPDNGLFAPITTDDPFAEDTDGSSSGSPTNTKISETSEAQPYYKKQNGDFVSQIHGFGKMRYIGTFPNEVDASLAYRIANCEINLSTIHTQQSKLTRTKGAIEQEWARIYSTVHAELKTNNNTGQDDTKTRRTKRTTSISTADEKSSTRLYVQKKPRGPRGPYNKSRNTSKQQNEGNGNTQQTDKEDEDKETTERTNTEYDDDATEQVDQENTTRSRRSPSGSTTAASTGTRRDIVTTAPQSATSNDTKNQEKGKEEEETVIDVDETRDILCGRGYSLWSGTRTARQWKPNITYQNLIRANLNTYAAAVERKEKAKVIDGILREVRVAGMRFLKKDNESPPRYLELNEVEAHKKIGQAIIDSLLYASAAATDVASPTPIAPKPASAVTPGTEILLQQMLRDNSMRQDVQQAMINNATIDAIQRNQLHQQQHPHAFTPVADVVAAASAAAPETILQHMRRNDFTVAPAFASGTGVPAAAPVTAVAATVELLDMNRKQHQRWQELLVLEQRSQQQTQPQQAVPIPPPPLPPPQQHQQQEHLQEQEHIIPGPNDIYGRRNTIPNNLASQYYFDLLHNHCRRWWTATRAERQRLVYTIYKECTKKRPYRFLDADCYKIISEAEAFAKIRNALNSMKGQSRPLRIGSPAPDAFVGQQASDATVTKTLTSCSVTADGKKTVSPSSQQAASSSLEEKAPQVRVEDADEGGREDEGSNDCAVTIAASDLRRIEDENPSQKQSSSLSFTSQLRQSETKRYHTNQSGHVTAKIIDGFGKMRYIGTFPNMVFASLAFQIAKSKIELSTITINDADNDDAIEQEWARIQTEVHAELKSSMPTTSKGNTVQPTRTATTEATIANADDTTTTTSYHDDALVDRGWGSIRIAVTSQVDEEKRSRSNSSGDKNTNDDDDDDDATAPTTKLPTGVTPRSSGVWQAQIYCAGKTRYIGVWDKPQYAARAYMLAKEQLQQLKQKILQDKKNTDQKRGITTTTTTTHTEVSAERAEKALAEAKAAAKTQLAAEVAEAAEIVKVKEMKNPTPAQLRKAFKSLPKSILVYVDAGNGKNASHLARIVDPIVLEQLQNQVRMYGKYKLKNLRAGIKKIKVKWESTNSVVTVSRKSIRPVMDESCSDSEDMNENDRPKRRQSTMTTTDTSGPAKKTKRYPERSSILSQSSSSSSSQVVIDSSTSTSTSKQLGSKSTQSNLAVVNQSVLAKNTQKIRCGECRSCQHPRWRHRCTNEKIVVLASKQTQPISDVANQSVLAEVKNIEKRRCGECRSCQNPHWRHRCTNEGIVVLLSYSSTKMSHQNDTKLTPQQQKKRESISVNNNYEGLKKPPKKMTGRSSRNTNAESLQLLPDIAKKFLKSIKISTSKVFMESQNEALGIKYASYRKKAGLIPCIDKHGPKIRIQRWKRMVTSDFMIRFGADADDDNDNDDDNKPIEVIPRNSDDDDSLEDNKMTCTKCDGVGDLLLCDGCDNSYHLHCLDPPLTKVPDGDWFCPDCKQREDYDVCCICNCVGELIVCDNCNRSFHYKTCLDPPIDVIPDGDWSCPQCVLGSSPNNIDRNGKQLQQEQQQVSSSTSKFKCKFCGQLCVNRRGLNTHESRWCKKIPSTKQVKIDNKRNKNDDNIDDKVRSISSRDHASLDVFVSTTTTTQPQTIGKGQGKRKKTKRKHVHTENWTAEDERRRRETLDAMKIYEEQQRQQKTQRSGTVTTNRNRQKRKKENYQSILDSNHSGEHGTIAPNNNNDDVRTRKWTPEEEMYTQRLIQEFQDGLLPLPDGMRLRTFLSNVLDCHPLRINKKFFGTDCLVSQKFKMQIDVLNNLAPELIQQTRAEISELERRFLKQLENHTKLSVPLKDNDGNRNNKVSNSNDYNNFATKDEDEQRRVFGANWYDKFCALAEYKRLFGNVNVPGGVHQYKSLGYWVMYQRMQYKLYQSDKNSSLTKLKIQALEQLGFEWRRQKHKVIVPWEERLLELIEYKNVHGNVHVPPGYLQNYALANWVRTQRNQHRLYTIGETTSMTAKRIQILERHGFSWFKPTKNRALPVPAIPVATKKARHNALLPVVASHRETSENVPTTIIPVRNFQIDDAQAIFDSLRGGEPHPSRLNFKIVLVGSDGLRLSPPTYAFEDGIYVLTRPNSIKNQTKYGSTVIPQHLSKFQMKVMPKETCQWIMSGPRLPTPTLFQQRYCTPKGNAAYVARMRASMWTRYDEFGDEDEEFRVLHVHLSRKRSVSNNNIPAFGLERTRV